MPEPPPPPMPPKRLTLDDIVVFVIRRYAATCADPTPIDLNLHIAQVTQETREMLHGYGVMW